MSGIPRFKALEDYTAAEHDAAMRAEAAGETFRAETAEYKQARREALTDAGLEDDGDLVEVPLDEMSPAQHFDRLRSDR